MKKLLVVVLHLSVLLSLANAQVCNPVCASQPAQCCNIPQASLFSALEPDTHDAPGSLFRGIMPDNIGATQCAVDSQITNLDTFIPQPGALFQSYVAPSLGNLLFALKLKLEFGTITGQLGGPPAGSACFKLDVAHFMRPPSPIMFTDGCGAHTFQISQPKYACVIGAPINQTLVCFAAKEIGPKAPLPPGFDRLEDVCTLVDLVP